MTTPYQNKSNLKQAPSNTPGAMRRPGTGMLVSSSNEMMGSVRRKKYK